ncbi:MAG TPA: thioesterase family protein [Gammaproteobacteria bacterium]|nr:thioesterase family protein [Gammaproteobacteria bacterium]
MASWQYDNETAITEAGPGRCSTVLDPAWNIGATPNGGYACTAALRALTRLTGQPDPLAVSVYYLRPSQSGEEAEIRTELIRAGRRASTAQASTWQAGRERLRTLATFGQLGSDASAAADPAALSIPPVNLPPPEECHPRDAVEQGIELAITSRVDVRIHPALSVPGKAGRAEVAGWIRFADHRPVDVLALVLFADAFPPSILGILDQAGWVPTLELTVHVRRRPVPGWITGRFRTRDLADGMLVEDGELWDQSGALVARSRQLALLRR